MSKQNFELLNRTGVPRILLSLKESQRFTDLEKIVQMPRATLVNQLKYLKAEKVISIEGRLKPRYALTALGKELSCLMEDMLPTAARIKGEIGRCEGIFYSRALKNPGFYRQHKIGFKASRDITFDLMQRNVSFHQKQDPISLQNVPYTFTSPNATVIFGDSPHRSEFLDKPEISSRVAGVSDAVGVLEFVAWLSRFLGAKFGISSYSSSWIEDANEELKAGNLILVGSPKINKTFYNIISEKNYGGAGLGFLFNDMLEPTTITSCWSGKHYEGKEYGVVDLIRNPYNEDYCALITAGVGWAGTWASSALFPKRYDEIAEGVTTCIVKAIMSSPNNNCMDVQIIEQYRKSAVPHPTNS